MKIGEAYLEITVKDDKMDVQLKSTQQKVTSAVVGIQGKLDTVNSRKITTEVRKVADEVSNLERAFERANRTLLAFFAVAAFQQLIQGFSSVVQMGINYNKTLENSRLGIASILASQGEFINNQGTMVKGIERINAAYQISDKLIKQLELDNLRTIATFEQLVTAFQQTLAPGLSSGLNLDQIRQFTVSVVQAAGALGLNLNMLAEETRSLLKGTINTRTSFIAVALGITPDDIKRHKGNAEELFNFLMGKLKAFSDFGIESQKTYSGLFSNMQDALSKGLGIGTNPFFEELKKFFSDVYNSIVSIDKETGEVSIKQQFLNDVKVLNDLLSGTLELVKGIGQFFYDIAHSTEVKMISTVFGAINDSLKEISKYKPSNIFGFTQATADAYLKRLQEEYKANKLMEENAKYTLSGDRFRVEQPDSLIIPAAQFAKAMGEYANAKASLDMVRTSLKGLREEMVRAGMDTTELDKWVASLSQTTNDAAKETDEFGYRVNGARADLGALIEMVQKADQAFQKLMASIRSTSFDFVTDANRALLMAGKSAQEQAKLRIGFSYQDALAKMRSQAAEQGITSPREFDLYFGEDVKRLTEGRDIMLQASGIDFAAKEAKKAAGGAKKALGDLEREIKRVLDSIKGPYEEHAEQLQKLEEIKPHLSEEQYALAIKKTNDELVKKTKTLENLEGLYGRMAFEAEFGKAGQGTGGYMDAGILAGGSLNEYVSTYNEDLAKRGAAAWQETTNDMIEYALEAARNIQDVLGDSLYNALTGKWDNMATNFAQTILRMMTEVAALKMTIALFGDFDKTGKLGGLLGGVLSGDFSFLGGSYTSTSSLGGTGGSYYTQNPALPGRAGGGSVMPGSDYLVGEEGPEILRMGKRGGGYVQPLGKQQPKVTVNVKNESGQPIAAENVGLSFDSDGFIADVIIKKMSTDRRFRNQMSQLMGG